MVFYLLSNHLFLLQIYSSSFSRIRKRVLHGLYLCALQIISAVTGGITDLSFDAVGYAWQIMNCVLTASYSVCIVFRCNILFINLAFFPLKSSEISVCFWEIYNFELGLWEVGTMIVGEDLSINLEFCRISKQHFPFVMYI